MPNWTNEDGESDFDKLSCKRCLQKFHHDKRGEVPPHKCHGGVYDSFSSGGEHHTPRRIPKEKCLK